MGRLLFLAVSMMTFTSCTAMQVSRMGNRYSPKPEKCEVRFEYINIQDPSIFQRYEQIGVIGLGGSVPDEFTDDLKNKLRPEACRIGGDVVGLMAHSQSGVGSGAAFAVYRDRTIEAPKEKAARDQAL